MPFRAASPARKESGAGAGLRRDTLNQEIAMRAYKTDETGEAILEILTANAKATAEDIARQLNVAESKVSKYIKQFEK